jgi:hypothetical protein
MTVLNSLLLFTAEAAPFGHGQALWATAATSSSIPRLRCVLLIFFCHSVQITMLSVDVEHVFGKFNQNI